MHRLCDVPLLRPNWHKVRLCMGVCGPRYCCNAGGEWKVSGPPDTIFTVNVAVVHCLTVAASTYDGDVVPVVVGVPKTTEASVIVGVYFPYSPDN